MRTRLDEIIEFEVRASGFGSWNTESSDLTTLPATVKRIAERAFRHGVEQLMKNVFVSYDTENVQPAPAEEKPEGGRYVCPHERCQMHHPDRRKGQRRAPDNWPMNWVHDPLGKLPSQPIFQRHNHGSFEYDRRSGRDRRKA